MSRNRRGRSAVAESRRRLRQQLKQHLAKIAETTACDSGQQYSPLTEFPQFMNLPLEIRRQIYGMLYTSLLSMNNADTCTSGWVIGNRTVHISLGGNCFRRKNNDKTDTYRREVLVGFICKNEVSDAARYRYHAESSDPDPREGYCDCHDRFYYDRIQDRIFGRATGIELTNLLDLRLLRASREANREATELFYSMNAFYFRRPAVVYAWLANVPANMRPFIRCFHLEMWFRKFLVAQPSCMQWHVLTSIASRRERFLGQRQSNEPLSYVDEWSKLFAEVITADFPGLRSLNLELHWKYDIQELWLKVLSQGRASAESFLLARRLKRLKASTIMIPAEARLRDCPGSFSLPHDKDYPGVPSVPPHGLKSDNGGQELRLQWAEEIRELVLRKDFQELSDGRDLSYGMRAYLSRLQTFRSARHGG